MASVAMMVGGAMVNALAFTGSNFLFSRMNGVDEERKRHDLAVEQLNRAHEEWVKRRTQRQDWQNTQYLKAKQALSDYEDGDVSAKRAYEATAPPPAGREPVLSDFYTPSEDQKDRELGFVAVAMTLTGIVIYKYLY